MTDTTNQSEQPEQETESAPEPVTTDVDTTQSAPEPQATDVDTTQSAPEPQASVPPVPKPSGIPKPSAIPTPASMARPGPRPVPPAANEDHSAAAAFGRVDENGIVHVRTKEGEREVGSFPGASPEEALTYFARKYDELYASAVLLEQRLAQPEVPSKDVNDALKKLIEQVEAAAVVGDLDALHAKLDEIQSGVAQKRNLEQEARAAAKVQATTEREAIVAAAETIADQPENKIQWKQSGARMRELLDEWKQHQRASTRLDRDAETALWQRFSTARNRFDKARRTHFAGLDAVHGEAKAAKERLIEEAERLSTSTDWSATAGAFKRLMDEWRHAGRASRSDDDKLWARFKAAQDAFFGAKDAVVAAEEEQFRGNLGVKEGLLSEAEGLVPVTDLEQSKVALRSIQDRWDAAGKVPRADMDRIEKALRRVEQAVRDADEKRWKSSNPEVAARAQGMVDQLERAVSDLESDLAKAQSSGNEARIRKAQESLDARRAWLEQAKSAANEYGG
ncbi:MAG: DUF349 domain-containing protein [Intrasporangium sp.]|uniref:DUF349 domain-containing protein n=1 Tax=Intrasporangium sp. TaxID=1925024 RepID=UPI002649103B|nr:DUF349 domain-containing protein [Intrasporangium sp.]MDN5794617.1 DUF349 domain-containing protein [Intrasporangium sp.]